MTMALDLVRDKNSECQIDHLPNPGRFYPAPQTRRGPAQAMELSTGGW